MLSLKKARADIARLRLHLQNKSYAYQEEHQTLNSRALGIRQLPRRWSVSGWSSSSYCVTRVSALHTHCGVRSQCPATPPVSTSLAVHRCLPISEGITLAPDLVQTGTDLGQPHAAGQSVSTGRNSCGFLPQTCLKLAWHCLSFLGDVA